MLTQALLLLILFKYYVCIFCSHITVFFFYFTCVCFGNKCDIRFHQTCPHLCLMGKLKIATGCRISSFAAFECFLFVCQGCCFIPYVLFVISILLHWLIFCHTYGFILFLSSIFGPITDYHMELISLTFENAMIYNCLYSCRFDYDK